MRSYAASAFSIAEAQEVVFDFLNQSWARVVLLPDGDRRMPAEGFNLVVFAVSPGGGLHLRIFREGALVFDDVLPLSGLTEMQEVLAPLWRRVRFFKAERTKILQCVYDLTGIAFPGRFSSVKGDLDPLRTPEEQVSYILCALKFHTIGWMRDELVRRGISLDAPLPEVDEDETRSLHDILADPVSPIAHEVMAAADESAATRLALDDLASRERQGMEEYLRGSVRGAPLTAAERRRIHDGKEAFRIILALHLLAESSDGRECLEFLARHLIAKEQNLQLLIGHFGRDLSLSELEPDAAPDWVRHRLLRAARVLWPFLAPAYLNVHSLMPDDLRRRLAALLASRSEEELAEKLGSRSAEELRIAVRTIEAEVAMLVHAVEMQASPKGRGALERRISRKLCGAERSLATDVWLAGRSLRDAAAALGVSMPEARKLLFRGLCRMFGRK